jgi:hypothetical protein
VRTFKLKLFHKWANKERLTDKSLQQAIIEMENGLIDADLGSHVYKKRVGIHGRGKRGGVRTLIAFKVDEKAFFMYGFAKKQRDNIEDNELKALKRLAKELLGYNNKALEQAIEAGEIIEVL